MRSLKYQELYERLFDQYSEKDAPQHFYEVLLLAAHRPDPRRRHTSICERGFLPA